MRLALMIVAVLQAAACSGPCRDARCSPYGPAGYQPLPAGASTPTPSSDPTLAPPPGNGSATAPIGDPTPPSMGGPGAPPMNPQPAAAQPPGGPPPGVGSAARAPAPAAPIPPAPPPGNAPMPPPNNAPPH